MFFLITIAIKFKFYFVPSQKLAKDGPFDGSFVLKQPIGGKCRRNVRISFSEELLVRTRFFALCYPPYLHDGRLLTLEDTVEFLNLIQQLKLMEQEKKDLVAFMRAL